MNIAAAGGDGDDVPNADWSAELQTLVSNLMFGWAATAAEEEDSAAVVVVCSAMNRLRNRSLVCKKEEEENVS